MTDRWIINRLGLINFWYYDEEVFEPADGKLIFRGSNGSGKSVTMQSFIPLLFDGNKSPERLDPFGTRARRLENYLLDENTDERTAYLYMEFKKNNSDTYITLGLGLKAQKGKPMDSWYFIINDGRRINEDIYLYKNHESKVALTKRQLQNQLGTSCFFTESQHKYMQKVNEVVFGFESIEGYEELLSLLIQLRSPKLSKDYKPTEIYNILTSSLKLLSEDDLRPMSESMENMDQLQTNKEEKKRAFEAVKKIKYHYDKYNRFCLAEKSRGYDKANKEVSERKRSIEHLTKEQQKLIEEKEEITNTINKLAQELKYANEKYESLRNNDGFKIKENLQKLIEEINELKKEIEDKEKQLENKKQEQKLKQWKFKEIEDKLEDYIYKAKIKLKELADIAQDFAFGEGEYLEKEVMENIEDYNFGFIDTSLQKYRNKLKVAKAVLKEYEEEIKNNDKLEEDKDKLKYSKESKESELKESNSILTDVKEETKEKYVIWESKNVFCKVEKSIIHELFRSINELDNSIIKNGAVNNRFVTELDIPITEIFNNNRGEKTAQKHLYMQTIKDIETKITSLNTEISELMQEKDIEPVREEGVIQNRQRLEKHKIPHIPFYKAIDFNKDTSENIRKSIESALNDMGILDALIINSKDKDKALEFKEMQWDKYLFNSGNMMRHNLTAYCTVVKGELKGVSSDSVYEALQGIYLDDDEMLSIDEKGNYTLGALKGMASQVYEPKYIGVIARKKHRELLIEQKKQEIAESEDIIEELNIEINNIDSQIKVLEAEYNGRPSFDDIIEGISMSAELIKDIEKLENEIIKFEEELRCIKLRINELKGSLYEATQGINITKTVKAFEEAEGMETSFRDELNNVKLLQSDIIKCSENNRVLEDNIEKLEIDIDNLYSDINAKKNKLRINENKVKALEDSLATIDIGAIELEIEKCQDIRSKNPSEEKRMDKRSGEILSDIKNIKGKIEENREDLILKEKVLKLTQDIFLEEMSLKYVIEEDVGEPTILLRKALKELSDIEYSNNNDYLSKLYEAYSKNSGELREFSTKLENIFYKENDLNTNQQISEEEQRLSNTRTRIDIRCRKQGKDMTINNLSIIIKNEIEELDILINAEERRIFEEVLLNTISSKISAKIYLSRQWVDKINHLMESMNTSSSLALSLKWVPKKAEREEQLDIVELLEVLDSSGRASEEDMKKLANHFGDKVKESIRTYEETGEAKNYHSIIKDVLDYRKWFEFKLYFTKKNERKRELTNNAFYQFSGGEKAMSMYIPLFSAVYARYENARRNCPRIVSLDEAFAGVDENNIRDMFRLLKELKLDYILNSQILWGDYDTVDNLAICELLREENDDVVSVMRYNWNGIEMKFVG